MKLDHIVLLVRDFATSLPFYDALLPVIGFTKTGEGDYALFMRDPDGMRIEITHNPEE